MTTRNNTCEGTNTNTVTTSNTGGADQFDEIILSGAGTTCTFSNTQAHSGSTSIKLHYANVASTASVRWSGITGTANGYTRFYIYATAQPGANTRLISWVGSGANRCGVQWLTTGKLRILNGSGSSVSTGTVNVPLNQWVRVEFDVTGLSGTTGNAAVRFYSGAQLEGSTPDETISASGLTTGGATIDDVRIGTSNTAVTHAWDLYVDRIDYSDVAQPGPSLTTVTGTLGTTLDNAATAITATETISGTAATTLAGSVVAVTGTETMSGSLSTTLDDVTPSLSLELTITGALATTLDDATVDADGYLADVLGAISLVLQDATVTMGGTSVVPFTTYFFEPPTHEEPIRTREHPLIYFRQTWANSIVRINGVLTSIRSPGDDLLQAAGEQGVDYFIGGYVYEVSLETASELLSLGYSVRVVTDGVETGGPFIGYGYFGYGEIPYGGSE